VTDWPRLKERQIAGTERTFSEKGYKDINFKLVFVEAIRVEKPVLETLPLSHVASENLAVS
jgi:hypothetical protein